MTDTYEIRAGDLKPLRDLYPRRASSPAHVFELCDALRAGAGFPPLIVQAGTLLIVDGFHRWSAYTEVKGPNFMVPCVLRVYADDREMFQDAVRENARHGLRFTGADQGRVIMLAAGLKLKAVDLVPVLRMTQTRMQVLRAEFLTTHRRLTQEQRGGAGGASEPKMKRPKEATGGRGRSAAQNPALSQASFHASNLALLLASKAVDADYAALSRPLAQLRYALKDFLTKAGA